MTSIIAFLARLLPGPLTIEIDLDWGHSFITVLPFVVLVQEGAELGDDECDVLHEKVHVLFDLVAIAGFTILGFFGWPGGWLGAGIGAFVGHLFYAVTNAFENGWPEQTAERIERTCRSDS